MDRAQPDEDGLTSRRLFSVRLPARGEELLLGAEAAQHARVLRLSVGDGLELFDGQGGTVAARVTEVQKRALRCQAEGEVVRHPRGPRLVLVQCVPKAGKLDDIVRMTTEIGVAAIRLALSERCVSRSQGDRAEHKLERLTRIAVEAARQSEQAYIPEISAPRPLAHVLAEAPARALKLALTERSDASLKDPEACEEVWLVVGPEGGFADEDRGTMSRAGFHASSLGRSILRTQTAAVVGVALMSERLRQRR